MTDLGSTSKYDAAAYDLASYNGIQPGATPTTTLLYVVRALLLADPTASGLLGSTSIGGIDVKSVYPVVLPDGQIGYPAIRMYKVSEPTDSINGARKTRVQIDCYASTYSIVQELAVAVRTALSEAEWVGDTITILNAASVNSRDGDYDAEKRLYHAIEEISFVWRYTP